jgi:hypothetical protein
VILVIKTSDEGRNGDQWLGIKQGIEGRGSSIIARGRGRVGERERYTLVRFFGYAVANSLFPFGPDCEGGKRAKDGVPMFLAKVVGDVVHVPCSLCTPKLRVELLGRLDKITGSIRFVRAFDLTQA